MHKAIANALNKKIMPLEKKWFDITYVDKMNELDNTSEFAFTITDAKRQFADHHLGTGRAELLTINMREVK